MTSMHYARDGLNCLFSLAWAQYRSPTNALLDREPTGKPIMVIGVIPPRPSEGPHGKTAPSAISRVSGA
jgi:hypothetical protein